MKTIFIVEMPTGKWRYYKNRKVGTNGLVHLDGGAYVPHANRARERTYRSLIPPFRKVTVKIWPFRYGDPEPVPFFSQAMGDYPRVSPIIIEQAMRGNRYKNLISREFNLWAVVAILAIFGVILLSLALYSVSTAGRPPVP